MAAGICVGLLACGGGGGGGDDGDDTGDDAGDDAGDDTGDDSGDDAGDDAPQVDADPSGWRTLVSSDWTLAAGDEGYLCATKTMTEDVYAHVLRPIAPLGTHHTVIAISATPSGADNPSFPCGPEFGAFWASGVSTPALELPDGVALLAPAGSQLRLSLHLFNSSDAPLSGTSGLEVQTIPAAEVEHAASVSYYGPSSFSIPSNDMPYTATHTTAIGNRTIVAIFPHMHQLGEHFRAELIGGAGTVLWDDDYQFESQEFAPLPSVTTTSDQTLETQCTWRNDTGSTIGWGDSSTAEMCYSILMSY